MDASNIVKRLWIGAKPPFDRDLPDFDTLVLCAQEHQGKRQLAFSRQVIRVPLPDSALDDDELRIALVGARDTAKALVDGKRVLVVCHAGRNRSALVAGLALGRVSRLKPLEIVYLIRKQRAADALSNTHFVEYLKRFNRN